MVVRARTPRQPSASETDADISMTGWDPYIVAITGGLAAGNEVEAEAARQAADSRESRLMAWLREHGA